MLVRVVHWLGETAMGLTETERRRSRVLAWMQITLILLVSVALVLNILFETEHGQRHNFYIVLIVGLLVILLVVFGMNRKGHYLASAILTVTCAFLGPWASLVGDPTVLHGDFVPLTYLVIPVILASILLSVRITIIMAGIQLMLLLSLPHFIPATGSINWASFLIFIFSVSILGAISNFINRQDLRQIDRQTQLLQESEARLRELSVRDSLTGLFNRRYLEETLGREINRSERKGLALGIIMLDIDHFKHINDTYGHAAGDAVLHQLGVSVQAHIRGSDIACRYGGEEFVVVMPETSLEVTHRRAEHLRLYAKELTVFDHGMLLEKITISLGVAAFPEHGGTYLPLLAAADAAMYRAKNEGRDRVVVAGN